MDTALVTVPVDADSLHVVLVGPPPGRRGARPGGWALPGTFLHERETLAEAVLRSLRDKAGVVGVAPRQLHVFDELERDDRGRVVSVAHLDVVPWSRVSTAVTDRDDVRAVPVAEAVGLRFDHGAILRLAVAQVRGRYAERPDPDRLLAQPFTLLELRRLHEAVQGRRIPKDSFRRMAQPWLRPTGSVRRGEVGKPAELYRHLPRRAARR